MQYRVNPKNGDNLSVLGYGCMRLPRNEGDAARLLRHAIDSGVNYLDTAYIYMGNEAVVGRALEGGYRERVKLATKLPPYFVRKYEDFDRIFNTQLKNLKTDYIDYYLIHMLPDAHVWERLKDTGFTRWFEEKRAGGRILNLGFSYHGGKESFIELLDANDWDFCMIQYNFYDENNQAGRSGLEYAAQKGLPVMVMEPLRGGKLVNALPKQVYQMWNNAAIKRSPAEWALRWVWNQPEVTLLLSGMNTMDMLDENLRIANEAEPESFTEGDFALFDKARALIAASTKVPCTACGYCMPCPHGVDIPTCFYALNQLPIEGRIRSWTNYLTFTSMTAETTSASRCVKCGACEAHCPQGIAIRDNLDAVKREFEGPLYKPVRFIIKKFMKF
ncbi:MAG: aldo/keto reductase [Clostridiales bacterium]|jgi:predicted aldo/keto reductase-like oxidoreductase|nr:aldo/keto reductase [Clostridiales bacterium]